MTSEANGFTPAGKQIVNVNLHWHLHFWDWDWFTNSFWIDLVWSRIITCSANVWCSYKTVSSRTRIKVVFCLFRIHLKFIWSTFKQTKVLDTWTCHAGRARITFCSVLRPTTIFIASKRKTITPKHHSGCCWNSSVVYWKYVLSEFPTSRAGKNHGWKQLLLNVYYTQIKPWGVCSIPANKHWVCRSFPYRQWDTWCFCRQCCWVGRSQINTADCKRAADCVTATDPRILLLGEKIRVRVSETLMFSIRH